MRIGEGMCGDELKVVGGEGGGGGGGGIMEVGGTVGNQR